MRKQIISRAFYGWLTYVRNVNIVRKHLKGKKYLYSQNVCIQHIDQLVSLNCLNLTLGHKVDGYSKINLLYADMTRFSNEVL